MTTVKRSESDAWLVKCCISILEVLVFFTNFAASHVDSFISSVGKYYIEPT